MEKLNGKFQAGVIKRLFHNENNNNEYSKKKKKKIQ